MKSFTRQNRRLASLALTVVSMCLGLSAQAQTVLYNESWEDNNDGWGTVSGANMTLGGFSTTFGVTEGNYSLILDGPASGGPNYADQFASTASTALTAALANSSSVTLEVYVPAGDFGYYLQWDLALNQQGGLGYASVDGYSYAQDATIGGETTLTWTIPASMQATLAANPTLATSVNFQIGGGFTSANDAVYLDDFTISQAPEPATLSLCGLGLATGLTFLRRRKA